MLENPDAVLEERRLPRAGSDPLPFEDDEYTKSVEDAKDRVMKSYSVQMNKDCGEKCEVGDFLPLSYDPELIREYYDKRPLMQVQRSFEIALKSMPLLMDLIMDRIVGTPYEKVEIKRASTLREILVELGPTFIKVG